MGKRCLLSAYNKDGLERFGLRLLDKGYEIWASGGTARYLQAQGIDVQSVESLTGFAQLLDGRVKTLHPAVFAGILARDSEDDRSQLSEEKFPEFDLVFVDLYPYEQALDSDAAEDKLVELIDIGGIALLRAAAKNHARVAVAASYDQLERAISDMDLHGCVDDATRRVLAGEVFYRTSAYDSAIAARLCGEDMNANFAVGGDNDNMPQLRYGENPHQWAKIFRSHPLGGLPAAKILNGKPLSYNNYLDLDAAYAGACEFDQPSCTIVKHCSPCGMAIGESLEQAYVRALGSDPLSAFGGIVAVNRSLDMATAKLMKKHFFECIVAPAFEADALEHLSKKKNLRLLQIESLEQSPYSYRGIVGGMLVQQQNAPGILGEKWEVVSHRKPTDVEENELRFAMRAAKLVKSNTIVIARHGGTVGIGGGLPSRVDAAILAVRKAGPNALGAVAASDAFMPFPDSLYVLAHSGVTAIVQPGGSRNDQMAIDAANKLNVALVFTGMRHFRH